MKHNLLKSLIISVILLTGVSNAWGQSSPHMYLIGQPVNTWEYDNNNNYPINNYYGQYDRFCIYVWMENEQTFALHNGNHQYGPKYNDKEPLSTTTGNGEGKYFELNEKGNAWIYTGNSGLVRICVNQETTSTSSEYYPYVWVEELTKVMDGTEVMFYFGDTWNEGYKYLRTTSQTNSEFYWGWCGTHSNGSSKFGFHKLDANNTYATCCKAPIGKYYISQDNTWPGIQMSANAEAGTMYSLTNNGSDIINVISGVKPTWTTNESKIQVDKGTQNSGIAATCGKSVINKDNTIYYCYTQDNENFYRFDPTDISNFDCGTYTIWALACDGHIVVRSAESKTLQVGNAVTLAGTDYGTFKVTCGNREETISTEDVTLYVPSGTQLTITDIKPNDGYDKTMVYKIGEGDYTEFGQEKTLTITNNTIISEDFRTTEEHDIYLKITGNSYQYWISGDNNALPRILFVHRTNGKDQTQENGGNLEKKIQNFEKIVETSAYNIYKVTAPIGYHSFYLYPPHNYTESNLFSHAIIPEDPIKNCFEPTTADHTGVGDWIGATITTQPTGKDTDSSNGIGRYGIEYNGTIHYATTTTSQNASFTVPYGANIRVLKGEPGNEAYTESLITNANVDANLEEKSDTIIFENNAIDTIIEVIKDIEFNDFFVTKKPHIVYLGVPDGNIKTSWETAVGVSTPKSIAYAEHQYNAANAAICLEEYSAKKGSITYYKFTIPAGWNTFRFELKDVTKYDQYGNAPKHATIRFPYGIPTDENNCFTLTGGSEYEFTGTWGKAPQCKITLGYTDIGRYGVKDYLDSVRYAMPGKTKIFTVPIASDVEVLEGEPRNDAYNGIVGMCNENGTDIVDRFHDGENKNTVVTITRDTKFDDLFVTKKQHVVYLGVPNEGIDDCWHIENTDDIFIWKRAPYNDNLGLLEKDTKFVIDNITYYKYTLPAGLSNFQFQRKTHVNDRGNAVCTSRGFIYQIPTTEYNCFILDGSKNGNDYDGYWTKLPATSSNVGDYRVLYAEKELIKTHEEEETEDWETAFRTVYEHPSDIIKQTPETASKNTVSLHITTTQERDGKKVHPMVILQQFRLIEGNTYDWVNLQAHTVLPLKATGNMGMLPGRKKAFGDLPFYDDGIEVIKNYTQYEDCTDDEGNSYKGSGVWNFVVNQASNGSVELDLSQTEPYRGKYYIRTNNAPGYWENYKQPEHEITYSSYAEQHSGFSHYYCKWIDRSKADSDVSFIIANDYATNLSDPSYLFDDQHITNEWIPEDVNIRWAWEHMTNKVSRAYIRGTWDTNEPPARIENIVVDYTPSGDAKNAEKKLLYDSGDWIYSINLEDMKVGSTLNTLTAKYPSNKGYTQTFAENINMLVGDYDNKKSYIVRILYDFKIDKTLVALVPNENVATVGIDVLIERIDQGPATQVVAQVNSKKNNNEGSTVYGAFTFTQPHLTDTKLSEQEKLTYWFSFPFDVLLSDVYGFGEVGKYWMIKEYDGESRAEVGLTEDNTFWKFITKKSTVLQANKGYVLTLNKRLMNEDDVVYTNTDSICLYFPSQNLVTSINNGFTVEEDQVIEIPQWTGPTAKKEWNWNLIGIPSYANKQETITADHLYYFFDYKHSNDTYEVMYLGDHTFKSTFAYMVQFAGDINWHTFTTTPAQLAAQKDASAEINHVMRLELLRNNQREDKTYIQLTENENATEQFDMNFDLTKMANAKANLYSLIGNHQLAANVLPMEATTVPLGVIIKTAGEYTFSMPDGTAGITAELIDYQTNTRTNLLLDNYTVTLPAGTNNSRFALSLQPDKTVTSIDNIGNEATGDKVKKYLIDGKLYLQKDGVLYDAQGHAL